MREALYREYLLITQHKKISELIKYILIVFLIVTGLIIVTTSQAIMPFMIAISIGFISSVFSREDKSGSIAVLRTMPIEPYKYVLARYISTLLTYLGLIILIAASEKIAGLFVNLGIDSEVEAYKILSLWSVLIMILAYIPGYYKFRSKGIKFGLYIGINAVLIIIFMYLFAFNEILNGEFMPVYKIILDIILLILIIFISISSSIKSFKKKDL